MRKTQAMIAGLTTALLLRLWAGPGTVAAQTPVEPQHTPAPPPHAVIPVAEVATQATAVAQHLRTLRVQSAPSPALATIHTGLPAVRETIDRERTATSTLVQGQPTLAALQTQEQRWQRRHLHTTGWLHVLTGQALHLQEAAQRLRAWQTTWTATRTAAAQAPAPILQQIDATLAAIAAAQTPLEAQRTAILDLQSRVAHEVARCEQMLAQLAQVQQQEVTEMLGQDGLPLWRTALWTEARAGVFARVPQAAAASWAELVHYVRHPAAGLPLYAGLCLALALAFGAAHRQTQRWQAAGEAPSAALRVFAHPIAAAVLVTCLSATSPFVQVPLTVHAVWQIGGLLPMLRLTRPVVAAPVVPGLYALGGLFALDTVRQTFAGAPHLSQVLLVGETLAGLVVAGWVLGHLRRSPGATAWPSAVALLRLGAQLCLLTCVVGLGAGSLGYGRLARLVMSGMLAGGVTALALAASVRVARGVLAWALRVWPLRTLQMVRHHRDRLEDRLSRGLIGAAILSWVGRSLHDVGLWEPVWSVGDAVLTATLARGTIRLSVGDVLAFGLTVLGAYLLSTFLRFALDEDVYPRLRITAGQSYAASSLLHYVLLAVGVVVGLGVLGVDMTRMTVLASAFGVGIGFGMQSVVNNFVSGLILLFERPIHVGDVVELGPLQGVVRRIGIRASVVHTWQGADIIVPNSHLVTEQVTNWTLTDPLRRIDLPVGVNYGAVPQHVLTLLETVARAHPQVLPEPPPQALFLGYGDSAINFELRAWPDHVEHWVQVKSDLTTAVYEAVSAAGLCFPFPQREVRVWHEAEAVSAPVNAAHTTERADP